VPVIPVVMMVVVVMMMVMMIDNHNLRVRRSHGRKACHQQKRG
jgi:hypothetical protein